MSKQDADEEGEKSQFQPYFLELEEIKSIPKNSQTGHQSGNTTEDDELSPTKRLDSEDGEGEEEAEWLFQAGYSDLTNPFHEGQEFDEALLEDATSTLTKSQAATVKKRVQKLNEAVRSKKIADDNKKKDVRDIFPEEEHDEIAPLRETKQNTTTPQPDNSSHVRRPQHRKRRSRTAPEHRVIERALVKNQRETTTGIAAVDTGVKILSLTHTEPIEVPSSKSPNINGRAATPDSTLDLNGVSNPPFIRQDDLFKSLSIALPNITIEKNELGITPVDYLSAMDIDRVRQIALIELTAMFDRMGMCYRPIRKTSRKKAKENGVFGVSLTQLLGKDRTYVKSDAEIPIFYQKLIEYLEEHGLTEEGVLRVPGSTSRIKELQEEVEKGFYLGAFKFQDLRVNDAVGLLKLFLRELPSPLLTLDYVNAFACVEQIEDRKKQLQCLNLLILVLPDVYRSALKLLLTFLSKVVSHEPQNRMSLNNVAMIMAPNLFSVKSVNSKKQVDFSELKVAAGTSNITRMLVKYHNILWVVPFRMLEQVRKIYDLDTKKTKDSKSVIQIFNKKGKEKSKMDLEDVLEGIIRVQTPGDEEKVLTTVQLSEHTTAEDLVAKFTQDASPLMAPITRRSPAPRKRTRRSKTLDSNKALDVLAGIPPNKTVKFYLYEVGGNIGARCLDPDTNMLSLVRVNPAAEWIIRPRIC